MNSNAKLWMSVLVLGLVAGPTGQAPAQTTPPPSTINILYEAPKNPAHASILDSLREKRVLEKAREFYLPFRLPRSLTLKTAGCNGEIDSWFENDVITICYEYVEYVLETARNPQRPEWVTEQAAIMG